MYTFLIGSCGGERCTHRISYAYLISNLTTKEPIGMGANHFERLGREILQQKRLMDKLEEENRELRRQLTELREGRGIFLKIGDQRIALVVNGEAAAFENNATQADNKATPESNTTQTDNKDIPGRRTGK